jgi:hypothetical protein
LSPRRREFVIALLHGLWIYMLVLWGYIVVDMFVFPQYQFLGISAWIPIPQNIIADIAFPLSFVCFVVWRYMRKQMDG